MSRPPLATIVFDLAGDAGVSVKVRGAAAAPRQVVALTDDLIVLRTRSAAGGAIDEVYDVQRPVCEYVDGLPERMTVTARRLTYYPAGHEPLSGESVLALIGECQVWARVRAIHTETDGRGRVLKRAVIDPPARRPRGRRRR